MHRESKMSSNEMVGCVQERPIDIVVDGFIHLQQYHIRELSRGLRGVGTYTLRPGFPACDSMPVSDVFALPPEDIVRSLQQPSAEVCARELHGNGDCGNTAGLPR